MSAVKFVNRYRVGLSFLLLAALAVVVVSQARRSTSGLIKESALRAHIKYLADDLLEGRGTGATGGELAAKYIAAQLEALGLKGAGEKGSYFQPVALVGVKADPATMLNVSGNGGSESFKFADDYVAVTGAQTEDVSIKAPLVCVGL